MSRALLLLVVVSACMSCSPDLDWRELRSEEGAFSAMLPGKPRLDEHPMASEPGVVLHLWSAQSGGALFGIGYADHASADPRIMDRTRDALAGNIHGRIVEEHDTHVGTAREREFRAEGSETMLAARLVLSGSRLYQVVIIGRKGGINPADVEMFLSSFRLSPGRSQG